MQLAFIVVGGFFGAIARYRLSKKIAERFQTAVPYGTLTVNMIGSFLLGLLVGLDLGAAALAFGGTGFLGAFTTFSTFKLEGVTLAKRSRSAMVVYIGITYSLGIALCYAGYCAGRLI
ncbi:fluoride efflux transporter FluC [Paenibacillus sp. GYB003]|uniref:fluoride efflux transporter FluC n=1 Tax=Paenibacillus sp. GYB003 TaxID=2994392 RepID=UPI002F965702